MQDAGNLFAELRAAHVDLAVDHEQRFAEVNVGESLVLTATATGPNPGNLGYTWTMSNPIGAFGATSGGVGAQGQDEGVGPSDPMQFMCTAPGTTTITLVVDDGAGQRRGNVPDEPQHADDHRDLRPAPSNQVAAAWVELTGPNGSNGLTGNVAIARAVTEATPADGGANPCPTITINGGTPVQMNLRAAATTSLALRSVNTPPAKPALFPVSSCEYPLPAGATSAVVAGQSLPLPKANPTKIVVIGDTGCRLQNGNGTQSCNDPNPNGTDTPYPFAAVAALAAAQNPDLVLHVGDYAYRDNPCPAGQGYNCGGSPWGFGWDTWQADLFAPGRPAARRGSLDHDPRQPRAVQPRRPGLVPLPRHQPVRHDRRSHLRQPGERRHRGRAATGTTRSWSTSTRARRSSSSIPRMPSRSRSRRRCRRAPARCFSRPTRAS